jgi:VRR-NUC domain
MTAYRKRRAQFSLSLVDDKPRAVVVENLVLEADVQRAVLGLLLKHPAVAFAHRINTRVVDVADAKSKTGTRPMRTAPKGHPDIKGMLKNGRALYVECKSSKGQLTEEQATFLSLVNKHGGLAFVARSIDDVLRHLPLRGISNGAT